MPEKDMTDTAELEQSDITNQELNRIRIAEINPTCGIKSRADNYDEDDSDSNSNDESPYSPESEEVTIGQFDHADSLENCKITSMLRAMSMSSEKSGDDVESRIPKSEDRARSTRSSSESSHSPTSDEESEDDLNEDEKRRKVREKILGNFNKFQRDHNSNYKRSTNGNYARDEDYEISDSSDNEKSGTASEDDSDDEFIKRGVVTSKKQCYHSGKPYDRVSPEGDDEDEREPDVPSLYEEYRDEVNFAIDQILSSPNNMLPDSSIIDEIFTLPSVDRNQQIWDKYFTFSECVNIPDTSQLQLPQRVQLPLLSDSSSLSDNNERSPASYYSEVDYSTTDGLSTGFRDMMNAGSTSNTPEGQHAISPQNCENLGKLDFECQQDMLGMQSSYTTFDDGINQTRVYAPYLSPLGNMPEMQENLTIIQSDRQTSPSHIISDAFSSYTTSNIQNQNNVLQTIPNTFQSATPKTQTQNDMLPKINPESTSRGIVTIRINNNEGGNTATFGQNNVGGQTRNQQMCPVLNVQSHTPSTIGSHFQVPTSMVVIPTPVSEISTPVIENHERLAHIGRDLRSITPWSLSNVPSVPAFQRLKQNVTDEQALRAMIHLYKYKLEQYEAPQNELDDTYLMTLVSDTDYLSSNLARITPVLDKMEMIPDSLILKNRRGYDALYLAAINCPQFDYVTGVLAATLEKTHGASNIWQRTYNSNNDTLIHVIAAQGDSHANVLQELLALQKTSKHKLFDLSAQNCDGKTPLHVAVESHCRTENGVSTVNIIRHLLKNGAKPDSKDKANGNTALHLAMSNPRCRGIVQALLFNEASKEAINIPNYAGNTPVHCAAVLLNNTSTETQRDVCQRLIDAGGLINIPNRQNKTPLALVAADRREMIEKIFRKKS